MLLGNPDVYRAHDGFSEVRAIHPAFALPGITRVVPAVRSGSLSHRSLGQWYTHAPCLFIVCAGSDLAHQAAQSERPSGHLGSIRAIMELSFAAHGIQRVTWLRPYCLLIIG